MTTAAAKTIQTYLPTGEPRATRIAEITTRIVQAVLIPRSDLAQGKLRKELDLPGIYFLFGEGEDEAKPIVYIGQTEDARIRLESHNKRRTFWKTAIFFVSKTQNFTQAHTRYLEWYCLQRAKEVNRYTLDNDQIPSNSIVTVCFAGSVCRPKRKTPNNGNTKMPTKKTTAATKNAATKNASANKPATKKINDTKPLRQRIATLEKNIALADPMALRAALATGIEDITLYWTNGGPRKWRF